MDGQLTTGVRCLGERGVALPMALLGLVALSVLVTSALLTASTELALSRAQQEATRGLYEADGALERFVADRASLDPEGAGPDGQLSAGEFSGSGPGGTAFNLTVTELSRGRVVEVDGVIERRDVFAIIATPRDGWGRSVGALVEAARKVDLTSLDIDAAATFGGGVVIDPAVRISDGSGANVPCDSMTASAAIRVADGVALGVGPDATVDGAIVMDSVAPSEMFHRILGGSSIDELANHAGIQFGPRFGQPLYSGVASQWAGDPDHRWGCPAALVTNCLAGQSENKPVVAIDAGGGTVDIAGEHGQGLIIVLNGDLRLAGEFAFGGLVIVQGALAASGPIHVEGAVIAMGRTGSATVQPGQISGVGSFIRFNGCRVREAERLLALHSLEAAPRRIASGTFGWFEVVR